MHVQGKNLTCGIFVWEREERGGGRERERRRSEICRHCLPSLQVRRQSRNRNNLDLCELSRMECACARQRGSEEEGGIEERERQAFE